MFKIGELVSRNSYKNDIIFRIDKIENNIAYLTGVSVRLCADSEISDLRKETEEGDTFEKRAEFSVGEIRNNNSEYFYIPGKILHIDGDKEYLRKCLAFYKKANVLAVGVYSKEEDLSKNISKYLEDVNPDIVVITGHDSSIMNNSKNFSDAVKICRKHEKDYDKLIIIAGACQSDYEQLIKSGANFASSPKKINIHALDPAIIALNLSLSSKNDDINLLDLLSKTSNGKDGIGGVSTKGVMTVGYPR